MIPVDGDSSWDPNWWVKTSVNKEGWVAEMKIPFSQVRFDKNSGEAWGLEVARVLIQKERNIFLAAYSKRSSRTCSSIWRTQRTGTD